MPVLTDMKTSSAMKPSTVSSCRTPARAFAPRRTPARRGQRSGQHRARAHTCALRRASVLRCSSARQRSSTHRAPRYPLLRRGNDGLMRARALKENARKLRSMHARGYDTLKSIRTTGFMKSVTSFITLNHFVSLH